MQCILALLLCISSISASSIHLKHSRTVYDISSDLFVYEDQAGAVTINAIQQMDTAFVRAETPIPNFGFSKSVYWLKCVIYNSTAQHENWIGEIAMPGLHDVTFYIVQNDTVHSFQSGLLYSKSQRSTNFRNPSFPLIIKQGEEKTIYMRIQSQSSLILPVFLTEASHYLDNERVKEFFLGLYFGAMLIMALYNFYLFLSVKDRGYFYLFSFIVTFAFGQLTVVYGFLTDWNISNISHFIPFLHIVNFVAIYFGIAYSRFVLNGKTCAPRVDRVLEVFQYLAIASALISPLLSFRVVEIIQIYFNLIPLPFYLMLGIISLLKGNRASRFYLIAGMGFFIGLVLYNVMYGFNVIPYNTFIYFSPNVSAVIMVTLFSFALADRINTIKKEREKAREDAVRNLEDSLRYQKEKRVMEQELMHAKKMEAIGRCLSGIAHDMKNYLTPINTYSQIIYAKSKHYTSFSRYVSLLMDSLTPLSELAGTLLHISRKKTTKMEPVDVNKLVTQIASILKHSCRSGIVVKMKLDKNNTVVHGEKGSMHAAVLNCGLNAYNAIDGDGVVTLETETLSLNNDMVMVKQGKLQPGRFVKIDIKDTGCGIDNSELDLIFEPFYSSKKSYKGTGLGLVSVYNCIEMHQGGISVQSTIGKGSIFSLYFPCESNNTTQTGQNRGAVVPAVIYNDQSHSVSA